VSLGFVSALGAPQKPTTYKQKTCHRSAFAVGKPPEEINRLILFIFFANGPFWPAFSGARSGGAKVPINHLWCNGYIFYAAPSCCRHADEWMQAGSSTPADLRAAPGG
jgi:hypothetical protein